MTKKVLTIAGSDAGGGSGIQADLKTFQEFGLFGISTITSILSVNPHTKKPQIFSIPENIIQQQLAVAFSGGPLSSVKIGLLQQPNLIKIVEATLLGNKQTNIVIDPVLAVKVTDDRLQTDVITEMLTRLLPISRVITPNLVEAQMLSGIDTIHSKEDMILAAKRIHQYGVQNVVIKGGHRFPGENALDLFYDGENTHFLSETKINLNTNHGAGCTFAAAITAGLAQGMTPLEATIKAKKFVYCAISHGLYLNNFTGYVWHGANNQIKD